MWRAGPRGGTRVGGGWGWAGVGAGVGVSAAGGRALASLVAWARGGGAGGGGVNGTPSEHFVPGSHLFPPLLRVLGCQQGGWVCCCLRGGVGLGAGCALTLTCWRVRARVCWVAAANLSSVVVSAMCNLHLLACLPGGVVCASAPSPDPTAGAARAPPARGTGAWCSGCAVLSEASDLAEPLSCVCGPRARLGAGAEGWGIRGRGRDGSGSGGGDTDAL